MYEKNISKGLFIWLLKLFFIYLTPLTGTLLILIWYYVLVTWNIKVWFVKSVAKLFNDSAPLHSFCQMQENPGMRLTHKLSFISILQIHDF